MKDNHRSFKAIIFDLGGTLVYFDGNWPDVIHHADLALETGLKEIGLELDYASFIPEFRKEIQDYYDERETEFIEYTTLYILKTLLADYGKENIPEVDLRYAVDRMYAITQAHWQVEPDAHQVLSSLQEAGYRLGLISNAADDDDVQSLVDKAGIRPYFELIITSASEGIRKPNPRIFQHMLSYLEVPGYETAMVGDMLGADILGAQNAGMYSIWITKRADISANRAHIDTIKPDMTVSELKDLPYLLSQMS